MALARAAGGPHHPRVMQQHFDLESGSRPFLWVKCFILAKWNHVKPNNT